MKTIKEMLGRIPPPLVPVLRAALSFLAGVALAVMLDYLLYRVGLPGRPFVLSRLVRRTFQVAASDGFRITGGRGLEKWREIKAVSDKAGVT